VFYVLIRQEKNHFRRGGESKHPERGGKEIDRYKEEAGSTRRIHPITKKE